MEAKFISAIGRLSIFPLSARLFMCCKLCSRRESPLISPSTTRTPSTTTNPKVPTTRTSTCTLFLYLIPAAIAVDANRDGTIAFSGEARDTTSQDAPFRFWRNDDQDQVTADGENDVVPAGQADHLDDIIQGRRDLEDFTRLWLRFEAFSSEIANGTFKVGLKWKDATGAPAIKVYKSADAAGSTSYLTDDMAASHSS